MKDYCYSNDHTILTSDRDLVLQQFDMLLDTRPGEVFGEDYGIDLHQYLWDLKVSNEQISRYVYNTASDTIDLRGYDLSVDTKILYGTEGDIILITIKLSKDLGTFEKTYKIK